MQSQHYKEARTPASRGKVIDHLRVSEGEEGGHVVEHHYAEDGMEFHKPKTYTFGKDEGGDMLDHLRKHLHVNQKSVEESGERDRETEGEDE